MKRAAFVALLFIVPLAAFAASAPTQAVIVMTKQDTHIAAKSSLASLFDPNVSADERNLRELPNIHGFAANLTDEEIASLKASGMVELIEPDLERHAFADTVVPGQQTTAYGINSVNAPAVWPVTRGKSLANGPVIHVAIIDTGIAYNNPELAGAFKGGFNFVGNNGDPLDDNGHGTHVAGIIAAADNGAGVVGVASDVDIYSFKVLDACGSGRNSNIIAAVDRVIQMKKDLGGNWIINMSLGSDEPSVTEETEMQAAHDAGILIFAASGNSYAGADGVAFPAGYSTVESVGAIDSTNKVASFSQRGVDLKVVAPGVSVLSTYALAMVTTNDGKKLQALRADYTDDTTENNDLTFSACTPTTTNIASTFVNCGMGGATEFPASVKGKIALVQRGTNTFFEKAQNALKAGALGVVMYDNKVEDVPFRPIFATSAKSAATIPASAPFLMISQADGQAILATPNATITMTSGFESFGLLDGTSMSCPHAVGTAALVWAVSPNSTATNVATALEQTAKDLGVAGKDTVYGFGLIDALAAAKQLNPAAFSSGATPGTGPVHGRIPGRRGH
jgi:serine protease